MRRGATSVLLTATLLSGCGAPAQKVEIRPLGSAAVQVRPPNEQLAYARAQLAMGNIGLAIEAFRKAIREEPDSADPLAGLADSYAAMGRHDLARRYYEAALAVKPHDPALLQAVAPPAPTPAQESPGDLPAQAQAASSAPAPAEPNPPPAPNMAAKLPQALTHQPEQAAAMAPRLERLSPGEVALVTTAKPLWQAVIVARTRLSTTVRWVPLMTASAQPPIRLLNAARHQGLAARTRQALSSQGWRKLAIGDAARLRTTSVVLYPGRHESVARNLASRLGFRAVSMARGDAIVVLLGRDAVRIGSRPLRG
jgi:tetratricopeptide (TPR) repeat protein